MNMCMYVFQYTISFDVAYCSRAILKVVCEYLYTASCRSSQRSKLASILLPAANKCQEYFAGQDLSRRVYLIIFMLRNVLYV